MIKTLRTFPAGVRIDRTIQKFYAAGDDTLARNDVLKERQKETLEKKRNSLVRRDRELWLLRKKISNSKSNSMATEIQENNDRALLQ